MKRKLSQEELNNVSGGCGSKKKPAPEQTFYCSVCQKSYKESECKSINRGGYGEYICPVCDKVLGYYDTDD